MSQFLFGGDDVDKKIKVLSGGEKARVALAKTIVSKANFLILDEPTNHLDMHSVELLAEALNKYEGSIIFVSHDRYFISKTANKIWEIIDGQIKEFKGTYQEYLEWNERMEKQRKQALQDNKTGTTDTGKTSNQQASKNEQKNTPAPAPKAEAAKAQPINKEAQKELQKQQRKLSGIEEFMGKAQSELKKLEADLGNPDSYTNKDQFANLEAAYKQAQQKVNELNKEYEVQFELVMDLEAKGF